MTPAGTDLQASILIVDDDRGSLLAMEEVLRSLGARLVTASSGEEALRCVLEEDFAAILMDVRMPGIDGFTTARMIRERSRSRRTSRTSCSTSRRSSGLEASATI